MHDGIRPEKPGDVPMIGIGGDQSCSARGRFHEGAVASGPVSTKETIAAR